MYDAFRSRFIVVLPDGPGIFPETTQWAANESAHFLKGFGHPDGKYRFRPDWRNQPSPNRPPKSMGLLGPVDRTLGGGFGALRGLLGATLFFLLAHLAPDMV